MTKADKIKKAQEKINLIFKECNCIEVVEKVSKMKKEEILKELSDSSLRGRGGAGFPTSLKWKFTASAQGDVKYVICNADEGEPGTFKDRVILEKRAEKVFSGMTICGLTIGSKEGYVYLRGEYNYMLANLNERMEKFNKSLKDKGIDFIIKMRSGSGAYVCGEETALIESMEGKRGEARNKPPFPANEGYLGKPTVVNNVETFACVVMIMKHGAEEFKKIGTADSTGSKVFSVSGDTENPGIYELPLGMKLDEFVELFGDGNTKAVQVGGASGLCVPSAKFKDTVIGFEGVPTGGSMMLFNSTRSMYRILENYLEFFEEESCGQCTPCRVGCQQLLKGIEAIKKGEKPVSYMNELKKLAQTMKLTSKCGLGQSVASPFLSIVDNFTDEVIY